jgi:predicted GH43/DUF377 family glycosyl hydrolase
MKPPRVDDYRTPHKINRLIVEPSYQKGEFDSHAVDAPFLFFHEGRYCMTFIGWDGTGYQTGLAISTDLVTWHKQGLLLGRGPKGSATEHNVALTCILRDNELFGPGTLKKIGGRFIGTYHAYPQPGYEAGPAVIGFCYSDDLKTWKIEQPVLTPDANCGWEAGGLYKSWLLEHEGTYYLFYNAKDRDDWPWNEQTGVATSLDLVHWERSPLNPLLPNGKPGDFDDIFASDPAVFQDEGQWLIFYFGLCRDGHARNSLAFSPDLAHWTKSGEVLIDVGLPGSIDSRYAHKPGIITRDGKLYHYYCAVSPPTKREMGDITVDEIRGISVATS